MSILIKGMEMPIKKNGAVLIIYPDGKCAFEDGKTYQAVPIPPHGRLIDADALKDKPVPINCVWDDGRNVFHYYPPTYMQAIDEIVNAPTIIEAEGGE